MNHRMLLVIGLLLGILSTWTATSPGSADAQTPCPSPRLLGAQGSAATLNSNLLVINPANGAVLSTIGPIGFAVTGLAQNPLTGQIFGSTTALSTNAPRSLITVNTTTGAGTAIGPFGLVNDSLADLAFDNAGNLYGWGSISGNLFRVNQTTGAATLVGASGLGVPQGSGLTFAQGVLFLSMDLDTGQLRRINPATGTQISATPLVGGVPPGRPIGALAADPNSTLLFGARIDKNVLARPADLITIDPATGVIAVRGASADRLDAIVFECPPAPTPTPTSTATSTATATPTATGTALATATTTTTASTMATATATSTATNTPPPVTGTLVVCKSVTTAGTAAATFTFTTPPGGPAIPSVTLPAGQSGPVCGAGVTAFAGSVAVTEVLPTGFTLGSAAVNGVVTTPAGNTVTATINANQTTTIIFTNRPSTGTLVVCKQIQLLNPGGIGGIGGIGGLNPPGPLGGIGFNPLGPIGGPNLGIGGIGGIGGVGGLGLQGSTVTFTTPPGGPVIPAITIPAAQLGPVCAAGVAVAAGTVAVMEVVPAGFTLNSVTGGTLAGNTGTATITAGTTTTLTFINVPININIPNVLPILPPPPLQFIPPPPPPLLPPPPPAPMAGARAPAAFPEVPVIPEADSLFLVAGALVVLGGLVGLRRLRGRREDEA